MIDIRPYIRAKGLMPGAVLPSEIALAAHLGAPRPVAREALRGLSTLRVVDIGHGRKAPAAMPDASSLGVILDHTS